MTITLDFEQVAFALVALIYGPMLLVAVAALAVVAGASLWNLCARLLG